MYCSSRSRTCLGLKGFGFRVYKDLGPRFRALGQLHVGGRRVRRLPGAFFGFVNATQGCSGKFQGFPAWGGAGGARVGAGKGGGAGLIPFSVVHGLVNSLGWYALGRHEMYCVFRPGGFEERRMS